MTKPSDMRRFALTLLFAAWLLAFGYSFVSFAITAPDGDGFTKGANRVLLFLGWQGIASLFAIAIFGTSRAWPKRSSVRQMGAAPLACASLLIAGIAAVLLWAQLAA